MEPARNGKARRCSHHLFLSRSGNAALPADGVREGPARRFVSGSAANGAGACGSPKAGACGEEIEMNRFSKDLIEGLTEACEHAEGKPSHVRVHVVEVPDVRAIRRGLHMSQHDFARVYRIPLATLKNWEQGRRQPDAPAAAYLQAIARRPTEIGEALASEATTLGPLTR